MSPDDLRRCERLAVRPESERELRLLEAANRKTIEHQLHTRAMLQLELERLLAQLQLQQAMLAPEPTKRKRPAHRLAALEVDAAGSATVSSSSAGYATPTEAEASHHTSAFRAAGKREQHASADELAAHVPVREPLAGLAGGADDPLDACGPPMAYGWCAAGRAALDAAAPHGVDAVISDEDERLVYRSLPLPPLGLTGCAEHACDGRAQPHSAPHEGNARAPGEPHGTLRGSAGHSGGGSPCVARLLAQLEALQLELDAPEPPSADRLGGMLEAVRACAARSDYCR